MRQPWIVALLLLLIVFCFYHYLLGLMHLESLLLTGVVLFALIFCLVHLLIRSSKK